MHCIIVARMDFSSNPPVYTFFTLLFFPSIKEFTEQTTRAIKLEQSPELHFQVKKHMACVSNLITSFHPVSKLHVNVGKGPFYNSSTGKVAAKEQHKTIRVKFFSMHFGLSCTY